MFAHLLLFACAPDRPVRAEVEPIPDDTDDVGGDSAVETAEPEPEVDCAALPAPPDDAELIKKIDSSEDFAFADDGTVVHANDRGDLVRETYDGETEVILPGFGTSAGTRFLPDGDLVIANVDAGSIERVGLDGSRQTILAGMSYPNGLDVGQDGYVYVAEQTAGQVRRVDPVTGTYEIIARNLNNPNGVTFSPDQRTVYVGSFGGGIVYAIDRDEDGVWQAPRKHAGREGAFALNTDACETMAAGDPCYRIGALGPGICADDGYGTLACTAAPDIAACEGLDEGTACTTELLGHTYTSLCQADGDGALFCPALDGARIEECAGLDVYASCSYDGANGYCYDSFEHVRACMTDDEYYAAYFDDCEERAEGDTCQFTSPLTPDQGTCQDYSQYGYDGLLCISSGGYGSWDDGGGGFDAIGTDECGNLFVGEYITGHVLRWPDGGEAPETYLALDADWIPNMHWGLGVGGFEATRLYVMNRSDRGGLWELDVGVHSHAEAYP